MTPKHVICCGMRRSGSTMQYHVARAIVEAARADCQILKAHRLTDEQRKLIAGGDTKCLYIYRDIRDVIVSEMNLKRMPFSFANVCGSEIVADVLRSYREWMTVQDIYASRYEEVMADLKSEVARIAAYLQCAIPPEDIARIAEQNSIERTRQDLCAGTEAEALVLDRKTLLFNRHINSGESGQYHAALSSLQIKWIETLGYEWLVARGYPVSISPSFHAIFRPAVSFLYSCLRWWHSRRKGGEIPAAKT